MLEAVTDVGLLISCLPSSVPEESNVQGVIFERLEISPLGGMKKLSVEINNFSFEKDEDGNRPTHCAYLTNPQSVPEE